MTHLRGIAVRPRSGAPMRPLDRVSVTLEHGLEGDFRGRPGRRQVTVLSADSWLQACAELGRELPWLTRRANLLVSGIGFGPGDVGRTLCIGELELLITRETDPCHKMDQACPGLMAALAPGWRGGVCCRVLTPGNIVLGDTVALLPAGG
jgi:MOSC domain-containing protein YiiM